MEEEDWVYGRGEDVTRIAANAKVAGGVETEEAV